MARVALLHLQRSQNKSFFSTRTPSVYHCFRFSTYGRPVSTNPTFKTPINTNPTFGAVAQIRWASLSAGPAGGGQYWEDDKETGGVIYNDPNSSQAKIFKVMGLGTFCLSTIALLQTSVLSFLTFPPDPHTNVLLHNVLLHSAVTSLVSFSWTALFHWWIDGPCIKKIRWQPGSDSFQVEMLSWRARTVSKTIYFSDIYGYRAPAFSRTEVVFKADGSGYCLDTEHCRNMKFLARLAPQKLTHETAFKN